MSFGTYLGFTPLCLEEYEEATFTDLWWGGPSVLGLDCRRCARMVLSWHCQVTTVISRLFTAMDHWQHTKSLGAAWKQPTGCTFLRRWEVSGQMSRIT